VTHLNAGEPTAGIVRDADTFAAAATGLRLARPPRDHAASVTRSRVAARVATGELTKCKICQVPPLAVQTADEQ